MIVELANPTSFQYEKYRMVNAPKYTLPRARYERGNPSVSENKQALRGN
jgi:hypothetical protein